jgi:hypothetical protein
MTDPVADRRSLALFLGSVVLYGTIAALFLSSALA